MVERRRRLRSQPQLRDRQQEKADADQLQKQREWLLDFLPRRDDGGLLRRHPEAQRGHGLFAPRAVQQVQRHHDRRDRAQQRRKLDEGEIEEKHEPY